MRSRTRNWLSLALLICVLLACSTPAPPAEEEADPPGVDTTGVWTGQLVVVDYDVPDLQVRLELEQVEADVTGTTEIWIANEGYVPVGTVTGSVSDDQVALSVVLESEETGAGGGELEGTVTETAGGTTLVGTGSLSSSRTFGRSGDVTFTLRKH